MPRLRFVADFPRGPRGGHNDNPTLFRSLDSATRSTGARPALVYNDRIHRRERPEGVVLCVDIDEIPPVDASIEDQLGHHEHRMLHHTTELQRLGNFAVGNAAVLTTTDMAGIREAVAEWDREEDRRRRAGGEHGPAAAAFFLMRDLWRAGKLG